jgi:tRNA (guanine-N7-)-methyltransferase
VSRTLKTDIPGPDRRLTVADVQAKGWEGVFGADVAQPLPLVVEIGFGRGEFLRELARNAPHRAHLGVDVSWKRVLKMARRIAKTPEERNLRLLCARGEEVLAEAIADASVASFWINFPDPWPKARHQRRRLVQPPLVRQLARRLVPGGELHVATDDADYAGAIHEALAGEALLENALAEPFAREIPGRLRTAYESMWRAEGRVLHFFEYRRRT